MKSIYCGKCHKEMKSKFFHKDKHSPTGYCYWCKECKNSYERDRYLKKVMNG